MLRMQATGVESLWDEILPAEVKALPEDLAALDQLLCDPALLAPIAVRWERLLADAGRHAGRGRPTIAMETYVRLMIIKHRSGWGYETLMRGGVGLDPPAAVLPDRDERAGAGRVDGPQAHPPAGSGGRARDHARADSEGPAGEAVQASRGADRLDRGRGRREISDRLRAGGRRRPSTRARGSQTRGQDRREAQRGQGPHEVDGPQAQGADTLDPPPLRGSEDRSAEADRRDGHAAQAARSARHGNSPRPPGGVRAGAALVRS